MHLTHSSVLAAIALAFATQATAQLPLFGSGAFEPNGRACQSVPDIYLVDAAFDNGDTVRNYDAAPDAAQPEFWDPRHYLRRLEHLA